MIKVKGQKCVSKMKLSVIPYINESNVYNILIIDIFGLDDIFNPSCFKKC